MKKILISIFILLSASLAFSEEVTPIYEYRNEALRNIDTKMNAERDRGRLKRLNREFEEELKNYIESVNGNTEVIFQLANQYFRMNEYDRARKIFSMDKTDIRNVFGAATTARFLGRNEEAISLYNDALNIDSSFMKLILEEVLLIETFKIMTVL